MKETYSKPVTVTLNLEAGSLLAASDGNTGGNLPGFTNGEFTL